MRGDATSSLAVAREDDLQIKQLAGRIDRSVSQTSRLVDQLVRRDLVDRREADADRRLRRLRVSAIGAALLEKLDRIRVELLMQLWDNFTEEDLPDASFAGQQDTYLNVHGPDELVDAVRRCWASLDTERAIACRQARRIDDPAMAVVVQRMVDRQVAGVLFTANPITGTRTEMVVDAARGLGTPVVDGSVNADHYVIGDNLPAATEGDCLTPGQLGELRRAGRRRQDHFGTPQDVEWAIDGERTL